MGAGRTADGAHSTLAGPHDSPARDGASGLCTTDARVLDADPSSHAEDEIGAGHSESGAHTLFVGPDLADDGVGTGLSGESGRRTTTAGPDLAILHASLGHYARQLADLQKLRIAQGNRVAAMEREGLPEPFIAFAREAAEALAAQERALNAYLAKQAKRHPMAPWIAEQRGIGLPGFARLLGITGPLDRFATVSKLWKYLGLHTVEGRAPKRVRGEKLAYSPQGRVLCHQIGESIVKMGRGGEYRRVYDEKRADYLARERTGPSGCPTGAVHKTKEGAVVACVKAGEDSVETSAHVHAMARRYAVKRLIRRMWTAWREIERERANERPQ